LNSFSSTWNDDFQKVGLLTETDLSDLPFQSGYEGVLQHEYAFEETPVQGENDSIGSTDIKNGWKFFS
jgi:hypothetical protein